MGSTIIKKFQDRKKVIQITPKYISGLRRTTDYGYADIFYHPKFISKEASNDNSTVKLFRTGSFNVLSLGDIESTHIASSLKKYRSIKNEVDVMILAHHGANNGFTTDKLIKGIAPKAAICTSNYDNQYEHPKQEFIDLLHRHKLKLFTSKSGDVSIYSSNGHYGIYKIDNLKAGSSEISSSHKFRSKKMRYLNVNADTLRERYKK